MLMAVVQTTKRFKEMYLGHVRLNKVKPFFLLCRTSQSLYFVNVYYKSPKVGSLNVQ
jgi:hypothetical protein